MDTSCLKSSEASFNWDLAVFGLSDGNTVLEDPIALF